MQLAKLSNKIRPLTLAAGLISATSLYASSDVDSHSGIFSVPTDHRTSEYIKSIDQNDNLILDFKFKHHLANWENKTMFLSSPKSIIEDEDFRAIVAMGNSAIPFIIEEIDRKPSPLVWALNFILRRKITDNHNATITDACKLWVKTLTKRG